MKINPVLRNESKLTVRTARFTLMLLIYVAVLSTGALIFYYSYSREVYVSGINMKDSINLYIIMAVIQAILLMFIVPSLTATSICSEREKQTLDILLSTKLSPLQIIIGKLSASSLKVIMLIVCTIPLYAICGLIGGIKIRNILGLIGYFIVCTIFVGSVGVLVSSYSKTSKAATAITYGVVLFIFVGTLAIVYILLLLKAFRGGYTRNIIGASPIVYLSPVTGFVTLLLNQVGAGDMVYTLNDLGIYEHSEYISIAIQIFLSILFIFLAARRLNPLNKKEFSRRKIFRKKKK